MSRKQKSRSGQYQLWKDGNHAVLLDAIDIWQKISYIHQNPVRSQLVDEPVHYLYSSARDYAGKKGLVNILLVDDEKVL